MVKAWAAGGAFVLGVGMGIAGGKASVDEPATQQTRAVVEVVTPTSCVAAINDARDWAKVTVRNTLDMHDQYAKAFPVLFRLGQQGDEEEAQSGIGRFFAEKAHYAETVWAPTIAEGNWTGWAGGEGTENSARSCLAAGETSG
jgi:hypothetical protein